ncbi:MAG: tetratricopeptide repeat protein, partial [Methylococcaceae bacterium]|nr:tetratricopeptide repeat protein [Methylococcaceae bacterium]
MLKANKRLASVTLDIPFAFLISFSAFSISNSQADNNPIPSVTLTPTPDLGTPCSLNLEINTEHTINKYEVLPRSPYALWDHFPQALFNTLSSNHSSIDTLLFVAYKYRNSGHPNIALNVLEQAQGQAKKENNTNRLALIKGGMSDAYLLLRNLDQALISSKKSVTLARQTENNLLLATALNHYGNALATMQRYQEALLAYREGELLTKKSSDNLLLVKIMINSIHVLIVQDSISEAVDALKEGSAIARKSSSLFEKTYILVSLGYLAHHLQQNTPFYLGSLDDVSYSTLTDARTIAEEIADANIQSYTLGHLGEFHAAQQHEKKAYHYFQQAISLAKKTKSPELTARWLWQLGRLFKMQNKIKEAETSYREALFQLAKIQSALVYGYRGELQSFREDIGAIYLELVDILVQKASSMEQEKNQFVALKDTLNLMEQFRKIE